MCVHIIEQARQMLQRRDEAYMTVDAYRQAFEEQLEKSRCLSRQLASLATSASRAVKARAAIKWLLSVLADGEVMLTQHAVLYLFFSSSFNPDISCLFIFTKNSFI